jgi:membrane-bound lytic murein transglycosylase A
VEARRFFEAHFIPYEISGDDGREGLFTGYYEPLLNGALEKKPPYLIPLHARPDDLVSVNLGDFKPDLKGETIVGRVTEGKLIPYFRRAEIEGGALAEQDKEIVWVDSAVDAFFLHIQGSGQVKLEDGSVLRVGYAAQNGHPYLAIGKALIERGALSRDNVSMQSIRAWLEAHPDEAPDVMNLNASYVFFQPLEGEGPLGGEGVALTPQRSLAIDRKKIPYGVPLFLDAEEPEGGPRLRRLMVAQDTGGAIRGAVRGDYFWGAGEEAARKAGLMKSKGNLYALLPKGVDIPEGYRKGIFSARKAFYYNP